jgi:hypothetical protein
VPIDTEREMERGGKVLLDFLTYCVMAFRMEPVFAYLARDYRLRPTSAGAVALHDVFLAPAASARLRAVAPHLPPLDLRMEREVRSLRPLSPGEPPPDHVAAPRHLFDGLLQRMGEEESNPILLPGLDFDPARTPEANLPGGRMTQGQRAFVERVWQPGLRPRLVAAGFWRIRNVA